MLIEIFYDVAGKLVGMLWRNLEQKLISKISLKPCQQFSQVPCGRCM